MGPLGQSSSQPLPPKELGAFKKAVKHYENKQYKFGLKLCKTILANPQFADHGETLAMRGLLLNCLGKNAEAQDSVKRGLKSDIRSYVCWHVYGLVQRADKKYDEAMKAYKMALRICPDNLQILRDLSLLQIQMRDLDGYRDSRYQLLKLRPTQKVSWIGYAVSYHLLKDYDKALKIVGDFLKNNQPSHFDFEHSELVLYENMILRESGDTEKALAKLEENAVHIYDRVVYMETRANMLMKLGRAEEAGKVWRQLVDRNPENTEYYDKLEQCTGLGQGASVADRVKFFDELSAKHKRAAAPKRIPLYLVSGDDLRSRLSDWIVAGLRKGVPSLFKNLTPLYEEPAKVAVIESVLSEFLKKVETEGYSNVCLDDSCDCVESPTTPLWLYVLAAQHYDRVCQTTTALKYIDLAIQHTPTLIELLMCKAKIYKHAGDWREAARLMEEAQSLDTADRFINSKCAKYMLRAGQMEQAEAMCAKFTREGVPASQTLNEMQCMWYELGVARAHRSASNYGETLKKCHQIEQLFLGIVEEQFDFHTYCLRKMTLSAYVQLLRLEDVLRQHDYYYQAAKIAIKVYLRMVDRPEDMKTPQQLLEQGLTQSELKKLRKKQREEKEKAEEERKKRERLTKKEKEVPSDLNPPPALDPVSLLKTEKPLNEACKFVQPLLQLGSKHVTAYVLGFEVYLRKNKPLLMLKCLNQAAKLDAAHPQLHLCRVKYLHWLSANGASLTGMSAEMVAELTEKLFGGERDAVALNETFKKQHSKRLEQRIAVAEASVCVDASTASNSANWVLKSVEDASLGGRTLVTLGKLYDAVMYGKLGKWSDEQTAQLVRLGHQMFPEAIVFGGGIAEAPVHTTSDENCHSFE